MSETNDLLTRLDTYVADSTSPWRAVTLAEAAAIAIRALQIDCDDLARRLAAGAERCDALHTEAKAILADRDHVLGMYGDAVERAETAEAQLDAVEAQLEDAWAEAADERKRAEAAEARVKQRDAWIDRERATWAATIEHADAKCKTSIAISDDVARQCRQRAEAAEVEAQRLRAELSESNDVWKYNMTVAAGTWKEKVAELEGERDRLRAERPTMEAMRKAAVLAIRDESLSKRWTDSAQKAFTSLWYFWQNEGGYFTKHFSPLAAGTWREKVAELEAEIAGLRKRMEAPDGLLDYQTLRDRLSQLERDYKERERAIDELRAVQAENARRRAAWGGPTLEELRCAFSEWSYDSMPEGEEKFRKHFGPLAGDADHSREPILVAALALRDRLQEYLERWPIIKLEHLLYAAWDQLRKALDCNPGESGPYWPTTNAHCTVCNHRWHDATITSGGDEPVRCPWCERVPKGYALIKLMTDAEKRQWADESDDGPRKEAYYCEEHQCSTCRDGGQCANEGMRKAKGSGVPVPPPDMAMVAAAQKAAMDGKGSTIDEILATAAKAPVVSLDESPASPAVLEYPCCEAVRRIESVPGDATTIKGGECPIHGKSVFTPRRPANT